MKSMLFRPVLCFSTLLALLLTLAVPLVSADTTVSGTIATDTIWTLAGSPYIVTSNITVKGTDGADGITTLTIEPGVRGQVQAVPGYERAGHHHSRELFHPRCRLLPPVFTELQVSLKAMHRFFECESIGQFGDNQD